MKMDVSIPQIDDIQKSMDQIDFIDNEMYSYYNITK